jgi:PKD repeat protein
MNAKKKRYFHQTVNVGEEAYFSGSGSHDRDGHIVAYYWVFGNGLMYTGENITYIFDTPGDYEVTLTVEDDFGNTDTDTVTVTVEDGTPPSEDPAVWIESLTTYKLEYEINDTMETEVTVERGPDMLTYVWEGTLVLDIIDDSSVIVFTDEDPVYLPSGGDTQTFNYEYVVTESGDLLIRATLFDFEDNQVDLKETSVRVSEGSPGGNDPPGGGGNDPPDDRNETDPPEGEDDPPDDGNDPPDDGDRDDLPDEGDGTIDNLVWIGSLTTDKGEYLVDETINVEVVLIRGDDWLTYVWEGTLVLEAYDAARVLVFSDQRDVYIPSGGMSETHNFEFSLSESGKYLVIATLYDFEDTRVDLEELDLIVTEDNSGGDGTVPSHGIEPPHESNLGSFTGDKGGIFQMESGMQFALVAIVSIALITLSSFAIIRFYKRPDNKKEQP